MWSVIKARLKQGFRTGTFPRTLPVLPERFQGLPCLDNARCKKDCQACIEACPANAISRSSDGIVLDTGKCLFCGKCASLCPEGVIRFSNEHDMATFSREELLRKDSSEATHELQPRDEIHKLCKRSLRIRQVSAGGCAACELDFNVLNTLAWDMARLHIQVVASPRHADCLLVTGPISKNMLLALQKTYAAVPEPCFVIACGACAISGGIHAESPEVRSGLEGILPVDLYVPGCPPHPATLLDAMIRFMGLKMR